MPTNFPGSVDTFTNLDHNLVDAVLALETRALQPASNNNLLYHSLTHDIWMQGTTFNDQADDSYIASLWNVLWNTNAPDWTGQAGGASDPFARYLRCTHDANSQAGIVQFLASEDTIPLRGKTVSLSADLWGTSVSTLRMAVIEWSSTADAITSDVVGTWGTGNPTLATNWAYIGTPAAISISTTRTRYSVENLTIGASTNNLAVFIWTDAVEASTDLWNVARVKLEVGEVATDFIARTFGEELALTQKFVFAIEPGSVAKQLDGVRVGTTAISMPIFFPTTLRAAPATFVSNIGSWVSSSTPTGADVSAINLSTGSFTTITGALSGSGNSDNKYFTRLIFGAGTSFSGSAGAYQYVYLGPDFRCYWHCLL